MTRIAIIDRADMNAEQARVYDTAKQTSGIVGGPYHAYIRLPKLFEASQNMRATLASGPLSRREQQIVNLAVARHWNARYPWYAQARNSLSIGIEQPIIDAINARKTPNLADARERTCFAVASEIQRAQDDEPGGRTRENVLCRGKRNSRQQGAARSELRRSGKDAGAGASRGAGCDRRQLFDDVSDRGDVRDRSASGQSDPARLLGGVVDARLFGVHVGAVDDRDAWHDLPSPVSSRCRREAIIAAPHARAVNAFLRAGF